MNVGEGDRKTTMKHFNGSLPCGVSLITQGVDACKRLGERQDSGLLHRDTQGPVNLRCFYLFFCINVEDY